MTRGRDLQSLAADLRTLGVRPGQDLLVHSSLRTMGLVEGGAEALLGALREVAGPAATIVVPTHTAGNSGSSTAFREATDGLSQAELNRYVADMPGFDPATTPSSGMGAFAEYVRTRPGSIRSSHPQTSFAALGPSAADCTRDHLLHCHLGESSPVGWLYRHDAAMLLLGVGYQACSAFHLAEYRLPGERPERVYHCFTVDNGKRLEHELWDVDLDDSDFPALGARMDKKAFVGYGRVGAAERRLMPVRQAVGFALEDLEFRRRRSATADRPLSSPGIWDAGKATPERGASDIPGRYFFLSYARSSPLPPIPGIDLTDPPDQWIGTFFRDLSGAVRRQASPASLLRPGFLDLEVSSGPYGQHGLADELSAAEVFVPLLSPDYHRRSWPRTEWAGFERRLRVTGAAEQRWRFAPVLWMPMPAGEEAPGLADALLLADGAARGAYADYGLCGLLQLPAYRDHYRQIVGEIAARVVAIAEKAPLGPSPLSLTEDADPGDRSIGAKVFAITVMGRAGARGAQPAEYARLAAERLGREVRMTALPQATEQVGRTPGILLVDPDFVTGDEARQHLDAKVAELPPWVLPVVMASRATRYATDSRPPILPEAPHKPPDAVRGVSSLREFIALMPQLVIQAEREYLRHRPT
jgi:aminoglycoside N3'-acetyltransferase